MPVTNNVISNANFGTVINQINTTPPATPQNYLFNTDLAISGNVVVPAKLILEPIDGARFVAANSTSALTFEGVGLAEDCLLGQQAVFSNFAKGKVRWTGADYPGKISAQLFNAASASQSFQICNDAFTDNLVTDSNDFLYGATNKRVEITLYPGHFDSRMWLSRYHTLRLVDGDYTNSFWQPFGQDSFIFSPVLFMESDTKLIGSGMNCKFYGSTADKAMPIAVYTTSGAHPNQDVPLNLIPIKNKNIEISNIFFQGTPKKLWNEAHMCVSLANCDNSHIHHCWFDNWQGHSAYMGGTPVDGRAAYFPTNSSIKDCVFTNTGYSAFGSIIGRNIIFSGNTVQSPGAINYEKSGASGTAGQTAISVPNGGMLAYQNVIVNSAGSLNIVHPDGSLIVTDISSSGFTNTSLTIPFNLPATTPKGNSWTSSNLTVRFVTPYGIGADLEPNLPDNISDNIIFANNIFDFTNPKNRFTHGIIAQMSSAKFGVRGVSIVNNIIKGGEIGNHQGLSNSGSQVNSNLQLGIRCSGLDGAVVTGNIVQRDYSTAFEINHCNNLYCTDNIIIGHTTNGNVYSPDFCFSISATRDSWFVNNRAIASYNSALNNLRYMRQFAYTENCTFNGTTTVGCANARPWWAGISFTVSEQTFTITSVAPGEGFTTNAPTTGLTGSLACAFKFGNNRYENNEFSHIIIDPSDTTSKVSKLYTEAELINLIQEHGSSYADVFKYNYNGNANGSPDVAGWANVGNGTLFHMNGGGAQFYNSTDPLDKSAVDSSLLPPDNVLRSGIYQFYIPSSQTNNLTKPGNIALTSGKSYKFRYFAWFPSIAFLNGTPNFSVSVNGGTAKTIAGELNKVKMVEITFVAGSSNTVTLVINAGGTVTCGAQLLERV